MMAEPSLSRDWIKPTVAAGAVILLWVGYTVIQTLFVAGQISDGWSAVLGFVPGMLGLVVLPAVGISRQECFLMLRPISWQGVWGCWLSYSYLHWLSSCRLASGRAGVSGRHWYTLRRAESPKSYSFGRFCSRRCRWCSKSEQDWRCSCTRCYSGYATSGRFSWVRRFGP